MPVRTPNTKSDQDSAYNPEELHAAERFPEAYAQHGIDQLEKHANEHRDTPEKDTTAEDIQDDGQKRETKADDSDTVRQQEEAGGGWQNNYTGQGGQSKKPLTFKGLLQKRGPIALLLAILGIGGGVMVSVPSFMPIWLRSAAENAYGNASRSYQYHYKSTLRYRIGNVGACADNASSIRCKMASVNDKTMKRYADAGFKVDSEKVGDRHVIRSVTFPDGTTVNDGDAFVAHMDASADSRRSVFGVFNPRSGPYVGHNFTNKVLKKFGITKARIKLSGKDRDAIARSFNREVGAPTSDEEREQQQDDDKKSTEDNLKGKVAGKAGKINNLLGVACGIYDTARLGLGLVKAKNIIKYVAFGWFFLKLSDQIRAGDADSETIAIAAGLLTATATSGENKGKSALDSPGVRAMAYGDRTTLKDKAKNILLGGNPALKTLDDTLIYLKETFGGRNIHTVCKTASNWLGGAAISTALCTGGGGAAGTIVPGVGNAIGGVGGLLGCAVGNVVIGIVGGEVMGYIVEKTLPALVDYLSGAPLSFDMSPEDTGNALTIGAGLLFATSGQSSGMKLGTKDEVNKFHQTVGYQADREYAEVARLEARDTPFDIYNQYSFMGQIAYQLSGSLNSNIVSSAFSTVSTLFTNSRASLFDTAANAADMPSAIKPYTLGECQDPELAEKNIGCDAVGIPQTVQTQTEMTRSMESNLEYMVGNGYVEEDGTVNDGKDYAKYIEYCTGKDEAAPGTSLVPITEDDYEWPDKKCYEENEMMSQFRTYTARTGLVSDEDTQYDEDGGDATQGDVTEGSDIDGDDYKTEVRSVLGRAGTGQCVDFVLFRLVKHGVLDGPIALGNGKDVVGTLGRMGYKVDTTPAVHSVMSTPVTSQPQYGHTAMVSAVNADGSFVVEEYNFNSALKYGTRTISADEIKSKKMTFAHTEVDYK